MSRTRRKEIQSILWKLPSSLNKHKRVVTDKSTWAQPPDATPKSTADVTPACRHFIYLFFHSGNVANRWVTHSDNSATRASRWAAHLEPRPSRHQPGLRRRHRVVREPPAVLPAGLTEEVSRRWGRPGEGGSRPPLRLYELIDELCQDRRRRLMWWSCQSIDFFFKHLERSRFFNFDLLIPKLCAH